MKIVKITNKTNDFLYWWTDKKAPAAIDPGYVYELAIEDSDIILHGEPLGRVSFLLDDGRNVTVFLSKGGGWSLLGEKPSAQGRCQSHDPVDTGMSWSFCRICDATLRFIDFEWKAS